MATVRDLLAQYVTQSSLSTLYTDYMSLLNAKAQGCKGDGVTDDTTAIAAMLATGGNIYFPDGTYIVLGNLTVGDNTRIVCSPKATLQLSNPLVVGSATAASTNINLDIRVQPAATAPSVLVDCYNLQYCKEIAVELTGTTTGDFVYIHSAGGVGATDTVYRLRSNTHSSANGITLMNGSGTIASKSGDFVNGNLFVKSDQACGTVCCVLTPTASAAGSVSGTMNRNYFLRCDWNSYGTAAVKSGSAGTAEFNEFVDCTFEKGSGATRDVDLTTNAITGGQFFRHIATSVAFATQNMNARDKWLDSEQESGDYWAYYGIKASAVEVTNRKTVTHSGVITSATTSFVSSGQGTAAISPNFLGEMECRLYCEISNASSGIASAVAIYRSSTSVPASGTAVGTDTQVWASGSLISSASSQLIPVSVDVLDSTPTDGLNYFYYVALEALAGTAGVGNINLIVQES